MATNFNTEDIKHLEEKYYSVWNTKLKYNLVPNNMNIELLLKESIKTGHSLIHSYIEIKYKDEVEMISIDKIKVPYSFKVTKPSKSKVDAKRKMLRNGDIEPIIINNDKTLINNYITYLILENNGEKFVPIKYMDNETQEQQAKLEILAHKYNNRCYICNREVTFNKYEEYKDNYATLDHIVPYCLSNNNSMNNLALCCRICNSLKGQLSYTEKLKEVILEELHSRDIL